MLPERYQPLTGSVLSGGFGSVLPCQDTYLDRPVLFKYMHDPSNNAQLVNEITALSQARSRHVVDIYDVVVDDKGNLLGIIIEYLGGRNFDGYHLEAHKDIHKYLCILYQLSIALNDLHQAGITHRDLKLDNFKESASQLIKLFDFGISSTQPDYNTVNNRGSVIYAPPELYNAGAKIEPSLDVYAFGVCAWVLLKGIKNLPQVLYEQPPQKSGLCPSISSALAGLPSNLVALVDSCLAINPSNRPTSEDLVREIQKCLVVNQHKGVFVLPSNAIHELSSQKNNVTLAYKGLGSIEILYDGFDFTVQAVSGAVYINNATATNGMKLPSACVLAFGLPSLGSSRHWIPFFSSHPEVIL